MFLHNSLICKQTWSGHLSGPVSTLHSSITMPVISGLHVGSLSQEMIIALFFLPWQSQSGQTWLPTKWWESHVVSGHLSLTAQFIDCLRYIIFPELQQKIRKFEWWSPNSDIRIHINRISRDVRLFVFIFVWFFLLLYIRNFIKTNFQQIFNTG